jgi:hypothetical protein
MNCLEILLCIFPPTIYHSFTVSIVLYPIQRPSVNFISLEFAARKLSKPTN